VIAVTDGTNILWSWHIWKTTYAPNPDNSNTYDTYTTRALTSPIVASRSFKMMKYNLGATAIDYTAINVGNLGLLYQWGRKDPFVGAKLWTYYDGTTGTNPERIITTNASGYEWYDGSESGYDAIKSSLAIAEGYSDADATIEYSKRHPTHFILTTFDDWLYVANYSNQRNNLWSNPNTSSSTPNTETGSKSIYDPCPLGWKVPPQDSFTRFTTTGIGTTVSGEFNIYGSFIRGWNFYIGSDGSGDECFYPATGFRTLSSGAIVNVAVYGHYWTSSSSLIGTIYTGILHFSSNGIFPLNSARRGNAFPIRCAQE
jgi:hypothetical protein